MDLGTFGFIIGNHYLGPTFTGLRGKKLFLTISAVWGHCEISMRYLGGIDGKQRNTFKKFLVSQSYCLA